MQAEDVRFSDDELRQVQNQLLNILWNTFKFYELYALEVGDYDGKSPNVLDKWIIARLEDLTSLVTEGYESYDTIKATRPVKDFVSDFSTWYVRRSRDRFKSDDREDRAFAMATTRHVLLELAKLIAPVMPFIAEDIYLKLRKSEDPESVHLAEWPESRKSLFNFFNKDKEILENMSEVRRLVSLALEARSKVNIKVRQPLQKLKVKSANLKKEYLDILRDEINVKEVEIDKNLAEEVYLDTNLTPELIEEGSVRDLIRSIQEVRKEKGLNPGEKMTYQVKDEEKELFAKHGEHICLTTSITLEG